MLEEAVTGFLADLEADGVFGLLGFLEKLGDLFKAGVGFFFLALGLLDVVEEELIGFIINFLGRTLRVSVDVALENPDPVDFLPRHLKLYMPNSNPLYKYPISILLSSHIYSFSHPGFSSPGSDSCDIRVTLKIPTFLYIRQIYDEPTNLIPQIDRLINKSEKGRKGKGG